MLFNNPLVYMFLSSLAPDNVVELTLTHVSSVSEDGTCHFIDYGAITVSTCIPQLF